LAAVSVTYLNRDSSNIRGVRRGLTMNMLKNVTFPQFVVFEGVDGSGKTSLFKRLVKYYQMFSNELPFYADSFPGSLPGTLGEWVYRLHHNKAVDGPAPEDIAPPAL
jgi:hypothetical protein